MGCGHACLKAVLVALNVIFFLAGAAVLGVGLWLKFDPNLTKYAAEYGFEELATPLYAATYILMAFGGLTFIIGFCGCCGALKESKCLIGFYITFVVAILAAEIAGGVLVYVKKDDIFSEVTNISRKYLKENYGTDNTTDSDVAWNLAMKELKCCGIKGVDDFKDSEFTKKTGFTVPAVCCKEDNRDIMECNKEAKAALKGSKFVNADGCLTALEKLVMEYSTILIGVGAGVAGFELLVVIMAICFCCSIDKD